MGCDISKNKEIIKFENLEFSILQKLSSDIWAIANTKETYDNGPNAPHTWKRVNYPEISDEIANIVKDQVEGALLPR